MLQKVPITFEVCATVEIDADNIQSAARRVRNMESQIPMSMISHFSVIQGTVEVEWDEIED